MESKDFIDTLYYTRASMVSDMPNIQLAGISAFQSWSSITIEDYHCNICHTWNIVIDALPSVMLGTDIIDKRGRLHWSVPGFVCSNCGHCHKWMILADNAWVNPLVARSREGGWG